MTRVLIVDDDLLLHRPLAAMLRSGGYEVHTASSAAEALAQLELNSYVLVISDVDMPVVSGIQLVQAMDYRQLGTPVIFLSALDVAHVRSQTQSSLVRNVLQKPVRAAELLAAVQAALEP